MLVNRTEIVYNTNDSLHWDPSDAQLLLHCFISLLELQIAKIGNRCISFTALHDNVRING
jgi:hypothetical protein